MAKRRLNKKVVLIGSMVLGFLVIVGIAVILYFSRDPEKLIQDGDAAMKAAREATDEQTKAREYEKAESCYKEAFGLSKSEALSLEILFKLADVYIERGQWLDVMGAWNTIIGIDPDNAKARYGQLKYFYTMADSGMRGAWREVESRASEFIEVVEDANLLARNRSEVESFRTRERSSGARCLGPYLYLVRGRAALEMTRMGTFSNPDQSLARVVDDLKKVQEFEPANVDSYLYLAQAENEKGELLASRGMFGERKRSAQQAQEYLDKAVALAGEDARAHINQLRMKPALGQMETREQFQSLEAEYLSLVQKFPSSAESYSALARFYRLLGHRYLDKAIEAGEKAIALDNENVSYAMNLANLHYRKFSIYKDKTHFHEAIEVSKNTLALPDAQDEPGPREWANRMNRISLYVLIARCYIHQALEPCEVETELQKQEWIAGAEQAVHAIEQLFGSGENASVVEWQGMLELAKGNKNIAIKKLYTTYEQLKAASRGKAFELVGALLSYRLAKIFENTAELGAVDEFFATALRLSDRSVPDKIDDTKPDALLDYAEILLKLRRYNTVLNLVDFFEKEYWADARSETLRIEALFGAGRLKEAEEELSKRKAEDPIAIKLRITLMWAKIRQVQRAIVQKQREEDTKILFQGVRRTEEKSDEGSLDLMKSELRRYRDAFAGLVRELLEKDPNSVEEAYVVAVCNNFMAEEETSAAKELVRRYLENFPSSTNVRFYKRVLAEPEPAKILPQRRKDIEELVLSEIGDPIHRALGLGAFYMRHNELEKATKEFEKVFDVKSWQERVSKGPAFKEREEVTESSLMAANYLFEIALGTDNWELAEQIAAVARGSNLDDCGGRFFSARLAARKKAYEDALARVEECLQQKPIFSAAYIVRSNVNSALGNEQAAIEDSQKAASLNPLDRNIVKVLAGLLCRRNEKLGNNVTSEQLIETQAVLERAMALNPDNLELLSFYAEYISETEPLRAIAIRQSLQRAAPSVQNAILLGRLATKVGLRETDLDRKKALLDIANSSFRDARTLEPENQAALEAHAEYYRLIGRPNEAKKLLAQQGDERLLWRYYFRAGKFEEARVICEQLYQSEPKDVNVVKGLWLIAERTADVEGAKKYSQELISLEDSIENHLLQIQTFLKIGLVKEAEYALESFKEKNPDEPRVLLLEAWLAMRQGRLEHAMDLASRTLEADEGNAIAWRLKGETNLLMANYREAISDLKRSKLLVDEPGTRNSLAKAYMRARRYGEAIIELKNVIDQPGAPKEARTLLERIYLRRERKEALKNFYDETLEKLPDEVFWYHRAGAFAIAEGEFDRAERLYGLGWQKARKEISRKKNQEWKKRLGFYATVLDGYLETLVEAGKLDRVIDEGGKYVNGDFATIAYLRMAEAKLKGGDRATALQYCRTAVDKAGTNEIFVSGALRRMYSLLGAKEALGYCEEKLKEKPDSLEIRLAMFNLTKMNGEYERAIGHIEKCLKIVGTDSSEKVKYTLRKTEVLQLAYDKTSDNSYLKEGIATYESLLVEMPKNSGVLNNLAYMLAQNNERLPEALEYAKRAHEARPNYPGFLDTYAFVLYKSGKFTEADRFMQAAIQQYEQERTSIPGDVYEHLGMIKEELGAEAEALAAYEEVLATGVDEFSEAKKKRITAAIERLSQRGKK
ncbi:MAG: tetratricopeptide repeat protein [Planctomycetota bacterium]|jgi:tetratricopeptide (TPR) repeat protein